MTTTTLTLDKAGRVVLPKPVRDDMQLRAGDSLELESSEDSIVLRPRRGGAGLHQKTRDLGVRLRGADSRRSYR